MQPSFFMEVITISFGIYFLEDAYLDYLRKRDDHVPLKGGRPWLWPVQVGSIPYAIPLTTKDSGSGYPGYFRCPGAEQSGLNLRYMVPAPAQVLRPIDQFWQQINQTFVLIGGGVSIGFSIGWVIRMLLAEAKPQEPVCEDITALRESIQDVKVKTDVIYGNLEKLCPTIARIDERTQKINEIAINIRTLRELQQESPARESTDILTNYINASLAEYVRLETERKESECNVAYLSQENARLSSRIHALEQQLKSEE